jgi:hypothetical protein
VIQKPRPPAGDQGPDEDGKSGQPLSKQSMQSPQVRPPTLRQVFQARAEARAMLVKFDEMNLHLAVDELRDFAIDSGLIEELGGEDGVQAIMATAFARVRP